MANPNMYPMAGQDLWLAGNRKQAYQLNGAADAFVWPGL